MAKAKDQNTSLKSSLGGSCSALGFRSYDAKAVVSLGDSGLGDVGAIDDCRCNCD